MCTIVPGLTQELLSRAVAGAYSVQLWVTKQEALGAILRPTNAGMVVTSVFPALGKWRQSGKFKVSLGYILSLGPA